MEATLTTLMFSPNVYSGPFMGTLSMRIFFLRPFSFPREVLQATTLEPNMDDLMVA